MTERLDLYIENRLLRGHLCVLNRSFEDICDALGCEYDNESALMKIIDLKARAERQEQEKQKRPSPGGLAKKFSRSRAKAELAHSREPAQTLNVQTEEIKHQNGA